MGESLVPTEKLSLETVDVPTLKMDAEAHEMMHVFTRDWHRLRRSVEEISNAIPARLKEASTWGNTFFSLAVGLFLGLIPVLNGTKSPAAWVVGFYVGLGAMFLFGAILCFIFGGQKQQLKDVIHRICNDMDEMESLVRRPKDRGN